MAKEKEIVLLSDVEDLGEQGAIVKVADGYARNYLIPGKKAALVTDATRRLVAKLQRERAEREKANAATAAALVKQLEGVSVTIAAKAADGERLYGSVGEAEIADALRGQNLSIDKSQIVLEHPLKELGAFDVVVRVRAGADATIKVWVVEE